MLQALATAGVCITTALAVSTAIGHNFEQTAEEAGRRTRIEMQLTDHDQQLERLQRQTDYLVDATRRIEVKLGTSPDRGRRLGAFDP